jgi:hypothetical protein
MLKARVITVVILAMTTLTIALPAGAEAGVRLPP